MATPIWLDRAIVGQLHTESLTEFGGLRGIRDESGLESALARPLNRHMYEAASDLYELAAEYAFDIRRTHPFLDGNKRAGFLAAGAFLDINGWLIDGEETEVVNACLLLASGEWGHAEFAFWLRENCLSRA